MKQLTPILIVLLFVGVLYAQVSGTAEIPAQTIPAQRVTVTVPADTTVAKAADLAAAGRQIALLENRVKKLEADLNKVLDLEVLTTDGSRTIRSLIK